MTSDSATLLDLLGIKGRDSLEMLQKGVKKLHASTSVGPDIRTNIVTVTVTMRDPYLAAAVANRFVQTVNEFNTRIRQSQAGRPVPVSGRFNRRRDRDSRCLAARRPHRFTNQVPLP